MKYEVSVSLKDDVLDPEARAVCASLSSLGYKSIKDMKIKKVYVLEVKEGEEASREISEIANKHLANPVSERFEVTKI